jgi:signal transduction histidine kinase
MTSTAVQPSAAWRSAPLFRWSIGIVGAVVAGVLVFEALHISVFSRIGLPHEFCYLQQPKLVWLHVIADLLIGLAYVSISSTLGYLVYRASRDIPYHGIFLAFGLFIVSCGLTHFMEVWVIWQPVYWLSGFVKLVTATASVATAVALYPLLPKIFELISTARKSEQRRGEIEQLNIDLERFNYSVAHDLRAPLRSIMGFGDILREDHKAVLSSEGIRCIDRMQRSAERMDALVTGLLRYATIGRQKVELQPVPLDDVVRGATLLLERDINEKSALVGVAAPLPVVIGDPAFLQVVFQNLINNAVKFVATGVRPTIEIGAEIEGPFVLVSIADNGIGFPPEAQNRVFGIFERFHPQHPGTGIGLAVVQRAVERMNGQIRLEPRPDGRGTRFWVRLPRG